jgi:hypothetical protein
MKENWLPVAGFKGFYEVSNFGSIRSVTRRKITRHGIDGTWKGRLIKPATDRQGYKTVSLCDSPKVQTKKVHRLVAEAFIPNPLSLPHINHKNSNTGDNRVSNLEWCSNGSNVRHSVLAGRRASKLNLSDIKKIRSMAKFGASSVEIAHHFGVSNSNIGYILRGDTWSHVQ